MTTSLQTAELDQKPPTYQYAALAIGVLAVSGGAIFVRYAQQEVPSLAIATYRMGIAFAVVFLPTLVTTKRELLSLKLPDIGMSALAGLFLAIHFATWIYSLELTSVAVSVVVVNTAPVWVGLLSPMFANERLATAKVPGIVFATLGTMVVTGGFSTVDHSSQNLAGVFWAMVGAIGLAIYLLLGRAVLQRMSLRVYVTICYGSAALYLGISAKVIGCELVGFSNQSWCYLVALAVISQVIGHTANNWALRYFSAAMIAVTLLGEPICAALLAYFLFGEAITHIQAGGAALILVGIFLAAQSERS